MKIFGFFYLEKVIFHQNKKNSIIEQQGEGPAIHTTRDDNGRTGRSHPNLARLFFSILKLVSYKKIKRDGAGQNGDKKILKPAPFTFCFCFYF